MEAVQGSQAEVDGPKFYNEVGTEFEVIQTTSKDTEAKIEQCRMNQAVVVISSVNLKPAYAFPFLIHNFVKNDNFIVRSMTSNFDEA
jgi:hypothetical protein